MSSWWKSWIMATICGALHDCSTKFSPFSSTSTLSAPWSLTDSTSAKLHSCRPELTFWGRNLSWKWPHQSSQQNTELREWIADDACEFTEHLTSLSSNSRFHGQLNAKLSTVTHCCKYLHVVNVTLHIVCMFTCSSWADGGVGGWCLMLWPLSEYECHDETHPESECLQCPSATNTHTYIHG